MPQPFFIPTTILGLLALLCFYLYKSYSIKKKAQLDEINSLPPADKLDAIAMRLNELGTRIDTGDLTPQQKYDLLVKMMNDKTARYLISAIVLVILVIAGSYLIIKNQSPGQDVKVNPADSTAKVPVIEPKPLDSAVKTLDEPTIKHSFKVGKTTRSDFTEIQEAVDKAAEGDTILISGGNYDSIRINKSIFFIGDGPSSAIRIGKIKILGAPNIWLANVTIVSFIDIRHNANVKIAECWITGTGIIMKAGTLEVIGTQLIGNSNSLTGFYLKPADDFGILNVTIRKSTIQSFPTALALYSGATVDIDSCIITGNRTGIEVGFECTLTVKNSDLRNNSGGAITKIQEPTIDANPRQPKIILQNNKIDVVGQQFGAP